MYGSPGGRAMRYAPSAIRYVLCALQHTLAPHELFIFKRVVWVIQARCGRLMASCKSSGLIFVVSGNNTYCISTISPALPIC